MARAPTKPEQQPAGMAEQLADILIRYKQHNAELRQMGDDRALSSVDLARAMKPSWKVALDQVERDPVRFALRASAREIGWHAYAIGGLEFMHKVSNRVEAAGASGATLDEWWDGIGSQKGRWVA
jgi:hypothetical protein